MRKWKWLIIVLILGGFMAFFSLNGEDWEVKNKVTLTREQQDNIVKRIARNYEIKSITFTDFSQDKNTGTYFLNLKIDEANSKETTLPIRNLSSLDKSTVPIGLNPTNEFEDIRRDETVKFDLDISDITIFYLEE